MQNIPATKFKAQCLELMDHVAEQHVSYIITKRGKPVAKLVPLRRKSGDDIFGWLRAAGSIQGDIVNPAISPEAWSSLEEWDEMQAARKRRNTSGSVTRRGMRSGR